MVIKSTGFTLTSYLVNISRAESKEPLNLSQLEEASPVVKVLFHTKPSRTLPHFQSLAACLGISAEFIDIRNVRSLPFAVTQTLSQERPVIVLDVGSLETNCTEEQLGELAAFLSKHEAMVLLLVSDIDESATRFLRLLTNDAVDGLEPVQRASRVSFPLNSDMLSAELCGHSYSRKPNEAIGLTLSRGANARVVMTLDQSPTFVHVGLGKTNVFVWATRVVFNVLQPLAAEIEFEQSAENYIPAIIFLRFAFGNRCWRNPSRGAGIVIDDPLLKKKYGFINFPQLLGSARRFGYHVTLAFIPWNHWRSRVKDVRLFLSYSDCFSVCAHGCDHTRSEFKSTSYDDLLAKNFVARRRMDEQRKRTGLPSQPLMVCPQEEYSLEAMQAFADSRQFICLVNTACMPRDLNSLHICGADLLLPAQDSFFGFPIFKRHYWRDMSVFAMSLFLGKPAILVEHHDFFRNGPGGAEAFASKLAQLYPELKWMSLAETVMRTHLRRQLSADKCEIRFFTDVFKLEHELEAPMEYRLSRRIPATAAVRHIAVDGVEVPFNRDENSLTFTVQAERPKTIQVDVDVAPSKKPTYYSRGFKYQGLVAMRRALSELRDNLIARNGFALLVSQQLVKMLRKS